MTGLLPAQEREPAKLPVNLQPNPAIANSAAATPAYLNEYRPLAMQALGGTPSPVGRDVWSLPGIQTGSAAKPTPALTTLESTANQAPATADVAAPGRSSDSQSTGEAWLQADGACNDEDDFRMTYTMFPGRLLWQPPLANQREPRLYAKFTNARRESTIDTAVGGVFGLGRWGPADASDQGFELDLMAGVFSRFNSRRLLTGVDYRVGLPMTLAAHDWQFKAGYEHTSAHLGDEFIETTGRLQVSHVRDEIVMGIARTFWDQIRLYGQWGYSLHVSRQLRGKRGRYDLGIEWSRRCGTSLRGQPFAALDLDIRSDQGYDGNTTFQVGWQWLEADALHGGRIAFEYYDGRSPFGQFFRDQENWVGFVAALDF